MISICCKTDEVLLVVVATHYLAAITSFNIPETKGAVDGSNLTKLIEKGDCNAYADTTSFSLQYLT